MSIESANSGFILKQGRVILRAIVCAFLTNDLLLHFLYDREKANIATAFRVTSKCWRASPGNIHTHYLSNSSTMKFGRWRGSSGAPEPQICYRSQKLRFGFTSCWHFSFGGAALLVPHPVVNFGKPWSHRLLMVLLFHLST